MTGRRQRGQNRHDENIGSFYMGRMRPPPKPRRVLPRGLLSGLSLLLLVLLVWYAYPTDDEERATIDVPVIRAETAPYKFKPDDPGGLNVPHRDSTVFDPLEKSDLSRTERLMPPPEQPIPVDPDYAAAETAMPAPELNLDLQMKPMVIRTREGGFEKVEKISRVIKKPDPELPEGVTTTPPPKAARVAETSPAQTTTTDAAVSVAPPAQPPSRKPVVAKQTPKAAPAPAAPREVWVRLGSYRNIGGAYEDWDKLQRRYPQHLGKLTLRTSKVDVSGRGTFHRLEAGRVPEARAREICRVIQIDNPGGCLVVR